MEKYFNLIRRDYCWATFYYFAYSILESHGPGGRYKHFICTIHKLYIINTRLILGLLLPKLASPFSPYRPNIEIFGELAKFVDFPKYCPWPSGVFCPFLPPGLGKLLDHIMTLTSNST